MNDLLTDVQHELKGFSGCSLEVYRLRETSVVRKTARSIETNAKILREREKLLRLAIILEETDLFSAPKVLSQGTDSNGLAFYEMEFVPGWELDSHLPQMTPKEIDGMACRLSYLVEEFARHPALPATESGTATSTAEGGSIEREIAFLHSKFVETRDSLEKDMVRCPQATRLFQEYDAHIRTLQIAADCVTGLTSFCHGDLALDNVLIGKNGRLYLIDPLINTYETFLWDIAKVFQSSLVNWKQIKHGEFTLDLEQNKIRLTSPMRKSFFNVRFAMLILENCPVRVVTLYLAATLARAVKYWQTEAQLCALLLVTNELLRNFAEGGDILYESLDTMCR